MKIHLRLFAHFRSHLSDEQGGRESLITMANGQTIAHLIEQLGIPLDLPKVILLNGMQKGLEDELHDGDTVSIFPPVAGG